jgi:hypothetical protein
MDLEGDAIDGVDDALEGVKADAQVVDAEHDLALPAAGGMRRLARLDLDDACSPYAGPLMIQGALGASPFCAVQRR